MKKSFDLTVLGWSLSRVYQDLKMEKFSLKITGFLKYWANSGISGNKILGILGEWPKSQIDLGGCKIRVLGNKSKGF